MLLYFCKAQDPLYINYTVEDGLPSSEVYDIEIDKNNIIWITTDRGVCRYDGYEFKTYTTDDGLADNTNFNIFKNRKGDLLFTGLKKNISLYKDEDFSPLKLPKQFSEFLKNNKSQYIEVILEDDLGSFYLVFHDNLSPVIYKFKEEVFEKIGTEDLHQYRDSIDSDLLKFNNVYLYKYEVGYKTMRKHTFSKVIESDSNLYYFSYSTIYKKNIFTGEISKLKLSSTIECIYIDQKGNLWICTRDGLLKLENGDFNNRLKKYFSNNLITSINQDFEGNYWISTTEKGILFVSSFEIKTPQAEGSSSLLQNTIASNTLEDHIVFGNANSEIIFCDNTYLCNVLRVPSHQVKCHIEPIEIWNETKVIFDTGFISDANNVQVKKPLDIHGKEFHTFMQPLKNGDYIQYAPTKFNVQKVKDTISISSLDFKKPIAGKPTVTKQSQDETLYIGTINGLYKIEDYDYENYQEILDYEGNNLGRISDIEITDKGDVWVATLGEGLYVIINNTAFSLDLSAPFSSKMVNNIFVSNDSLIWIASNSGLDILEYKDPLDYNLRQTINIDDGLLSNYISSIEHWNNKIWLATNKGICYFDPSLAYKKVPPIPISIQSVSHADSIFSGTIKNDLHFDHDENDLLIKYSGISYRKKSINYRYRLLEEGSDTTSWYQTKERSVRYNNLPPGNYTFIVNAQNSAGKWNTTPATISFEVKPHFTDYTWFKLLMGLLVILFIALYIYIRIDLVNKREAKKRELQEALNRTQKAELSSLRNQMNPHFIFNSLNSIQNYIFKNDTKNASHYLSKFSRLVRQSLEFTQQDFISLSQEVAFLQNYLELEKMRFPGKFDYQLSIDEEIDSDLIGVPSLIMQPILENSIKHGFKNIDYPGFIDIKFELSDNDSILVFIQDNGTVITKEENKEYINHNSLGLKMIRDRIALLNDTNYDSKATFKYDSNDEGFKTTFSLPLSYKYD